MPGLDQLTDIAPPRPRGPLSAWAIARMWALGDPGAPPSSGADDGFSEDVQLALYLAYEGHFGAIGTFDEWDTELIAFRARLESAFVDTLRSVKE